MAQTNGINMTDVKKKNRSSILYLIYQKSGLSRKEIASRLGLTPAAITLITTDMINEGLIYEESSNQVSYNKGRREVLLKMNTRKYAAIGVYISKSKLRILCATIDNKEIFSKIISITDCNCQSDKILDKLCTSLEELIAEYKVFKNYTLHGIGISINGIVNVEKGISINSYHIFEENVHVCSYVEDRMNLPVILTNNICALANGESFLSKSRHSSETLFIKYGPGIGAARTCTRYSHHILDLISVELGHIIMDPQGEFCICGNRGCLETKCSYDSLENLLSPILSKERTPILYRDTKGDVRNLNINHIIQAYIEDDPGVVQIIDDAILSLALALQNTSRILEPESIILYGDFFEVFKFRNKLFSELGKYTEIDRIHISHYNLKLESFGPLSTILTTFFENGGFPLEIKSNTTP